MILRLSALILAAALALAGCQSNDGMDGSAEVAPPVNRLGVELTEAELAVGARYDDIAARSNNLLYTDFLSYTGEGEFDRVPAECAGNHCVRAHVYWATGSRYIFAPEVVEFLPDRQGISVAREARENDRREYDDFGGWMDHAFFISSVNNILLDWHPSAGTSSVWAYVTGEHPLTNPTGKATWEGFLAARDSAARDNVRSVVLGDATVTVALQDTDVFASVHLTNMENTTTGTKYSDITYEAIPVYGGAFHRRYAEDDYMRGDFYGPKHEEAAGIFENPRGLLGAFGAKKQD